MYTLQYIYIPNKYISFKNECEINNFWETKQNLAPENILSKEIPKDLYERWDKKRNPRCNQGNSPNGVSLTGDPWYDPWKKSLCSNKFERSQTSLRFLVKAAYDE